MIRVMLVRLLCMVILFSSANNYSNVFDESGHLNVSKRYTREELWKMLKTDGQMNAGQIFHLYDHNYRASSIKDGILNLLCQCAL